MPETAEQPIVLNEGQVSRIIEFAVQNKMYEGQAPTDPQAKLNDAATLVAQARRARDNGNASPAVQEICFIADVDQAAQSQAAAVAPAPPVTPPVAAAAPVAPPAPAAGFAPPAAASPAPTAAPAASAAAPTNGGFDISSQSSEDLSKILDGLKPNISLPAVADEIAKIEVELQRRQQGGQPAQEVASAPAAGAVAPPPGPSIPDASGQPVQPAVPPPAVPGTPLPPGALDASGQPRPVAADAAAAPGVQAAQPGVEGVVSQAPPAEDPGRRAAVEAQLSGAVLLAYGKTFADVPSIAVDDLERMIASPGGPVSMETTPTAPPPAPPSSEREALEEQITGPILKAYGSGRTEVPKMGLNELNLMIAQPGGATLEQVQTARVADGTIGAVTQQPPPPVIPPAAAVAAPPAVPPGTAAPAAPAPVAAAPSLPAQPPAPVAAPAPIAPPAQAPADPVMNAAAAEIIQREHLPIPPDVDDPPVLPPDISVLSDEQLRSLHGRFHAVEVRCNWIISQEQDYIDDLERGRNIQEAAVRNTPREGKKLTKDEMAAIVAADEQYIAFTAQIKDREKSINKIKVIRDNAHLTCQRCSREYSMRYREEDDVPRR